MLRQFLSSAHIIGILLSCSVAHAERQDSVLFNDGPRLFVDCNFCDMDYIRLEIPFVNYVRDRHDAQIVILVTMRVTASGGREYTHTFLGKRDYAGIHDTLLYTARESDSEETIRKGMARTMTMGLVRYVSRTPAAARLTVGYTRSGTETTAPDPWDYWVCRASINSYLNGERSTNYVTVYGNFSVSRATHEMKLRFAAYGNYSENNFTIDDQTISSFSRSKGFDARVIPSLSDHWSASFLAGLSSSTYSNLKQVYYGGPGIEFNVFPYSESTRQELRCAYEAAVRRTVYDEETIYDRFAETLLRGQLSVALELKREWGTIEVTVIGSHYMHDFKKNSVQLFTELEVRVVGGLSITVYGNGSMIHDQLSLPKRGASQEEVLLRRRQLETQFRYQASIGISYTFGSIYNNIVNRRFGT